MLQADTTGKLRFNWAETAWLPMWLAEGDGKAKAALLQQLVAQGKLEVQYAHEQSQCVN